jgi:hypothetical protein
MTVSPTRPWFAGLLPVALVLGCGTRGRNGYDLDVGTDDAASPSTFSGLDAGAAGPLDAHIERGAVTVTFVTLNCSGDCATVQAVGTGGNPPYTFAWENGSTSATREVCPTSSTKYSVNVSDTGAVGEIQRQPDTVQVPLAANVLTCPDGGTLDAGAVACPPDAAAIEPRP